MGDWIASLERAVEAQAQWSADMTALAGRHVPAEMIDQLIDLGPDGADPVRQMAAMDDDSLARVVERWKAAS